MKNLEGKAKRKLAMKNDENLNKIWGSHGGEYSEHGLLKCDAMYFRG